MLMQDVEQPTLSPVDAEFRPARPSLNGFGLLLLPIALLVYLIAMPFFALFWLIEWFLPLQPEDGDPLLDPRPMPTLHPQTEDSPSH